MTDTPFITKPHKEASKQFSGPLDVPWWHSSRKVSFAVNLFCAIYLHIPSAQELVEGWLKLRNAAYTVFKIFRNFVGDSSCDPVLTLQVNEAIRRDAFVFRRQRIALKWSVYT